MIISEISKKHIFKMAATRRLQKELGDLRKSGNKSFRDIQESLLLYIILNLG